MIQEKHLIFGAKELGVILSILVSSIPIMVKLELNREIAYMTILVFILSMVFLYCSFILFLNGISNIVTKKVQKLKRKGIETTLDCKRDIDIVKNTEEVEQEINIIRETKMRDEEIKLKHMQDVAEQYIIETFPPYFSNEDIQKLCIAVIDFSNGVKDFSNYSSITPQGLKAIDLMHFGWNIYNHFERKNRDVMLHFLKNIFRETLIDVSINTLKSKLSNDGDKGEIKIKKNLLDKNE